MQPSRSHARQVRADTADTLAERALVWICSFNLLFVLAFFTFFHLVTPVRAEAPACVGTDLAVMLQERHPERYAAARAEADATKNGQGLLWRVEKDGVAPSHLFGTMHVTDARAHTLGAAAENAFEQSGTLIIESAEILSPEKTALALMMRPDLTMFTDGTTLDALVDDADRAIVETALSERGIPVAAVRMMKPWMLSSVLAAPACEIARKESGIDILDIELANRAVAAGKSIAGLETVVEQLEAMASLPMDKHIEGLVETVRIGDRVTDVFETMVAHYVRGDIAMIMPLLKAALEDDAVEAATGSYAAFEQEMIVNRNIRMAERVTTHLDEGAAFVAVGALHLPGDEGLVALLRDRGYTVTRID